MAQPIINFNRASGGLGRPASGTDHISGLLFYNAVLPSGFATDDRIKKIQSIQDAETLGIIEGGTNSVEWYHINECFRINPKCVLYVGIYTPLASQILFDAHDFNEISLIQTFADGQVKQIGVFSESWVWSSDVVVAMNTQAVALATEKRGLSVLWSPNYSATVDITVLPTTRVASKYVSVLIGQDGANVGSALAISKGFSVGCIGLAIGVLSKSAVHESIGYVGKFNVVTGAEMDVPAFSNGQLVKDISNTALDTLDDNGFVFLKKYTDFIGTYFQFGNTAIATTSDFATIENNRVIEKAIRLTNANLLPLLNSPLTVSDSGTLTEPTIATFESYASKGIEQMERDGELSGSQVVINPAQDVLSSSKIEITLKLIPRGVAKVIEVSIGFATSLN